MLALVLLVGVVVLGCVGVLRWRQRRVAAPGAAVEAWQDAAGERNHLFWGYRDTAFEFCGPGTVRLTGTRYPLAGKPLPDFVPYVERMLALTLDPAELRDPVTPAGLPAPVWNEAFAAALGADSDAPDLRSDDADRLMHSHGQVSVDEVYCIASGRVPDRVVDAVVRPDGQAQVEALIRHACAHDVVLIPYGGGTNVSGALTCPVDEARMIVSVDMAAMDRILELDEDNDLAVVEAGISGRALEHRLAARGYTAGHIPDSIEFSTLGGWIATNASGMKKNRYGNIEDIVREAVLLTPTGEIHSQPVTPRNATGIQPRGLVFGHEGGLGIITRAVLQIQPLPACRRYASFVFPDFTTGLDYLHRVQRADVRPASIRLANNTEFRLGRALAPHGGRSHAFLACLKTFFVLRIRGFDPDRMVASTLVMEGSTTDVRRQWQALRALARSCGGLSGGSDGGRRGYQATFAIAYIRDFLNRFGILGETFETSAPWSRVEAIVAAVERELHEQCAAHGVRGRPYLSWRVSQSYPAGVCIYFTMGFCGRGLTDPAASYQAIEQRLRAVILDQGGSLSHHHGVGKVRQNWIDRVHTPAAIAALRGLKATVDPQDIFAVGNHVFAPTVVAPSADIDATAAVAPQRPESP